ncbi:MAG: NAD(P)-dependent oxidoreductase, partial [Burkholderiaceae bacterium]
MKTLLLTDPMPSGYFTEAIEAIAPDVELIEYRRDIDAAQLAGIEAVLGWRFPAGVAGRLPRLKWVCSVAAGVEKLLVPDLAVDVPVSRIVDAEQAEGIAQFVALMALRHARGLVGYEAMQRERVWRRQPVAAVRSRVTVLGMGAMGGAVARLLEAIGFEVHGWSRSRGGSFDAALASADIVVCALPLTPQTDALLGAAAFAAMPRGSYLINIARGAHVVEADLIDAVSRGQLGGAALDVQRNEPMAADDPLWAVPGITITPHIAAQSSPQTIAAQFVA